MQIKLRGVRTRDNSHSLSLQRLITPKQAPKIDLALTLDTYSAIQNNGPVFTKAIIQLSVENPPYFPLLSSKYYFEYLLPFVHLTR
jgi:hypothetical protein